MSAGVFDGSGKVKMFLLYYFENIVMRNKDTKDYSLELLSYLDGPAFEFFSEKFTTDGYLKPEAEYSNVLKEEFSRR